MIYIINAIIHTVIGFSLGVWYCRKKLEKALKEGERDAEKYAELWERYMKGDEGR